MIKIDSKIFFFRMVGKSVLCQGADALIRGFERLFVVENDHVHRSRELQFRQLFLLQFFNLFVIIHNRARRPIELVFFVQMVDRSAGSADQVIADALRRVQGSAVDAAVEYIRKSLGFVFLPIDTDRSGKLIVIPGLADQAVQRFIAHSSGLICPNHSFGSHMNIGFIKAAAPFGACQISAGDLRQDNVHA